MAVADLLRLLETVPAYRMRMSHTEIIDAVPPRFGNLDRPLSPAISSYLEQEGIRLYSHQCEAINAARDGKNVIITTPTASGKTLACTIPVF
jgi:DEAD/DEAH box helicase domain-containing protein